MQVTPSGGQICNQCKWRHLVAKFGTNASGILFREITQVKRVNTLGPLCLWQCFFVHPSLTWTCIWVALCIFRPSPLNDIMFLLWIAIQIFQGCSKIPYSNCWWSEMISVIEIIAMLAKLSKSMSIDGIAKYTKLSLMPAGWWCPQIISFNQRQKQVTTLCDQIGDNEANWTLEVRHQHCINALSIPRFEYLSRSRFQVSFYLVRFPNPLSGVTVKSVGESD